MTLVETCVRRSTSTTENCVGGRCSGVVRSEEHHPSVKRSSSNAFAPASTARSATRRYAGSPAARSPDRAIPASLGRIDGHTTGSLAPRTAGAVLSSRQPAGRASDVIRWQVRTRGCPARLTELMPADASGAPHEPRAAERARRCGGAERRHDGGGSATDRQGAAVLRGRCILLRARVRVPRPRTHCAVLR